MDGLDNTGCFEIASCAVLVFGFVIPAIVVYFKWAFCLGRGLSHCLRIDSYVVRTYLVCVQDVVVHTDRRVFVLNV